MTKKLLSVTLFTLAFATQPVEGRAQQQQTPRSPQPGQPGTQPRTQPGTNSRPEANDRNQTQNQSSSQTGSALTARSFVEKVAEANQKEIEMSRMASSRAQSSRVKSYAEQLVRDHTKSLDAVKKYSTKHGISLPSGSTSGNGSSASTSNRSNTDTNSNNTNQPRTENRSNSTSQSPNTAGAANSRPEAMAAADEAHMRELSSKSGAEFDQAYINMMITNHEKAVEMFEQQRDARDNDAELRGFVNSTLPTLRSHLSQARDLEKTVLNNNRSTPTPNANRPAGGNNSGGTRPSTDTSPNTSPTPANPTRR